MTTKNMKPFTDHPKLWPLKLHHQNRQWVQDLWDFCMDCIETLKEKEGRN